MDNGTKLEGEVNEGGRRGTHQDRERWEMEGGKERDKERRRGEERLGEVSGKTESDRTLWTS